MRIYLSYEEIAQDLGITRQCVAQTAKSGLRKIYKNTKRMFPDLSPSEIADELCKVFSLTGKDRQEFLRSFPTDIKILISNN